MIHHPLSTNLVVSADAASARSARLVVRDLCQTASFGTAEAETAMLLAAELVSNALEHGGGSAVLDAKVDDQCLHVAVADDDPTIPEPHYGELDAERGRGLMLVNALSSRWGADPGDPGKAVWFELDRV
ncbi:MAG: ATP-binding protein [Nocardioides sp.]